MNYYFANKNLNLMSMTSMLLFFIGCVGDGKLEVTGDAGAVAGELVISSGTANFGTQGLTTSSDQTLLILNQSGSSVTLGDVTSSGLSLPSDYSVSALSTCTTSKTIELGETCTLVFTYVPSVTGTYNASINLSYTSEGSSKQLALTLQAAGISVAGIVISNGTTYDFNKRLPASNTDFTFTVSNTAQTQATLGTISTAALQLAGAYSFISGSSTCTDALVMLPTQTCTITIRFTPPAAIAYADTIELDYSDMAGAQLSTRALTGEGDNTSPDLTINQRSGQADPTNTLALEWDVVFNEAIVPGTFTSADLTVGGTSTVDTWVIVNSGNDTNFILQATVLSVAGTTQPSIGMGIITDVAGNTNNASTSTDNTITYDITNPTDNTAVPLFTDTHDGDGNDLAITWTAFTDNISVTDHRIITYTNGACGTGADDHGLTGSGTNSNSAIVDGLSDATYWMTITAYDSAGNSTVSACSADSIVIDSVLPTDNTATLLFTDAYDVDGDNVAMTWTAFSDNIGVTDHKIITYTNNTCSTGADDHGLTASGTNSNNVIVDTLATGQYWATVTAYDAALNSVVSACSADSILVDTAAPTDNTATLLFTDAYDTDGNNLAMTWTAFSDNVLVTDHKIITYTNNTCAAGADDHGLTASGTNSNATIVDTLATGQYWATVTAYDAANNSTVSACSADSIFVDTAAPTDNTATLLFTDTHDGDGNNLAMTWTAFSDNVLVTDHKIITYTNNTCGTGADDHGLTGSGTNSNSAIVDSLSNGTYWATVTAYDAALNSVVSACSADSIVVDTTPPTDNTATLLFTDTYDTDGDNLAMTWTAFSDNIAVTDHKIITYTNNTCGAGADDHGLTGSGTNSNSAIVDTLATGQYWATVTAYDAALNPTVSACSADSILVDTAAPTDNTATLLFTFDFDYNGDNLVVTWTAFSDNVAVTDHKIITYTNNTCGAGADDHGLTGSGTNSDSVTVDDLVNDEYWATVTAYDAAGNSVVSACSADSITVDIGWYQEAYFKAGNSEAWDHYGRALAISGDTAVVGVDNEDSDQTTITNGTGSETNNNSTYSGAVFIYKRTGITWAQEAYIKAGNADANDLFGGAVAISGDTVAVGATDERSNQATITNGTGSDTDNSNAQSGAIYVYTRSGTTWTQEAYIKRGNNDAGDRLGIAISLYGDTLISGSQDDSNLATITNGTGSSTNNSYTGSGAIFVYKRTGITWAQEAFIKAVNNTTNNPDGLGAGVSQVSIHGDTIIATASGEQSNSTSIINGSTASGDNSLANVGAGYVYVRSGTTWTQQAYIKASNAENSDNFGRIVAISGDTIAIGTPYEPSNQQGITNGTGSSSNNSNATSGAVYVYFRTGTSWAQQAYFKADNSQASDWYSAGMALSGNTLVVGANYEDGPLQVITNGTTADPTNASSDSGAVYVYIRTGSTWAQEAYIKTSNNDVGFDLFGYSVAISGDTIIATGEAEDANDQAIINGPTASTNNSAYGTGAVYSFRNVSRLFEIHELFATSDASSVTLTWVKTGGTAVGYKYSYQTGATAPVDCDTGTTRDPGDVSTDQETGLTASTTYSFRICPYDEASTMTAGRVITMSTTP